MNHKKILKKWLEWTFAADPDNSVDPDTIEGLKDIRTSKTTKKDRRIFGYYGTLTRFEVIEGYKTTITGNFRTVALALTALELWLERYRDYEAPLRQFLYAVDNPADGRDIPDCVFGFLKEVYLDVLLDGVEIYHDYFEGKLS